MMRLLFWPRKRCAAYWYAKTRSGSMTPRDDHAFRRWMESDVKHARDYDNIALAWELSGELSQRSELRTLLAAADRKLEQDGANGLRSNGIRDARRLWIAGAAVASALVAVGVTLRMMRGETTELAFETGVGEQRLAVLPDHSTIALNTHTAVRVLFQSHRRQVELIRGEALFTVAHDALAPFTVSTEGGVSRAIGTQFAVRLDPSTTEVSVLEGVVEVAVISTGAQPAGAGVRLEAGRALTYSRTGELSAVRPAEMNRVRGWQAQRIVIEHQTLADAIAEMNRYSNTRIVLGEPRVGDRRVSGVFRIGDERAFIAAVEKEFPLRATTEGDKVVLLGTNAKP